ncbi:hypothetical protein BDY21DRAFT_330223 [Lineolata rhizophorae]|uniref:Uncharacterized protein n=1 Tax=Lineolata rhizophorae TaxID=578093 RepID=A0A6A6PE14_9PEZI|nr:hypothetical protein BDY21DRAFT_330223 [Lineolata rhizophorae]
MPSFDDRRERRSTLGYWMPLFLSVAVATAGAVAWVWSQREDESDSEDDNLSYGEHVRLQPGEETGFVARVQGAVRRTPSPQQFFDTASKRVASVVGGALSSITEGEEGDAHHNPWSEEAARRDITGAAEARSGPSQSRPAPNIKRRTVAVCITADASDSFREEDQAAHYNEHASLLSHIPHVNFATTNFFVLIYAPHLKSQSTSSSNRPASLGSSFSAISTPAQTPGDEKLSQLEPQHYTPGTTPALSATHPESPGALFAGLNGQAMQLVEKPTMVMPFTTPTSHVHMLRHLAPDMVYMAEAVAGERGENVEQVKDWVGQVIVVVGGDGVGLSGLVDTEDEGEGEGNNRPRERWWESAEMVGLGKGVDVVDAVRFGDDFDRRVCGKE